jgi:hypothetical protein
MAGSHSPRGVGGCLFGQLTPYPTRLLGAPSPSNDRASSRSGFSGGLGEGAYSPLPSGPQTPVTPPLKAAGERTLSSKMGTAARVLKRNLAAAAE